MKKGLRPVQMIIMLKAEQKGITLVYGNDICINCIKKLFDKADKSEATVPNSTPKTMGSNAAQDSPGTPLPGTQETGSSTSSTMSPAIRKEKAIKSLVAYGISSIAPRKRDSQGRLKYAKERLEEATEISKKNLCIALDLPVNSLESTVPQRAADMELLLQDIQHELPRADKQRTYQLLSLVPLSIPTHQACSMFNVSKTLYSKVRDTRIKQGILPLVQFSRKSSVPDSTKNLIVEFYCDDENSKVLPGKDDKISISKGVYEQKRLMLCNVQELYALFNKKYPDIKVGLSMFFKLRPKYCVSAGATGTHKICVCQTHEDVRLIVSALGIKTYYRDLIGGVVCDEENQTCMLRLCEDCHTTEQMEDFLREEIIKEVNASSALIPEEEGELNEFWAENISYLQWKTIDKQTDLVTEVAERSDVVRFAAEKLHKMIPHEFVARKQSNYFKNLKSSIPPNKVVVLMDFAMNFSCVFPEEIQSYHFSKKQVTLHPVVIFHRPEGQTEADFYNICFISDDLTHDVSMVKAFTRRIVEFIKNKFPEVDEIEYITDGCGAQYKNKVTFWNLCRHAAEFQIRATHSYFATSHGKNLCDALAGNIKRILAAGSLQCKINDVINSAQKVYDFLQKHQISEKVRFEFVGKEEVETERTLTVDAKLLDCVPGTRSFHFYQPQSGKQKASE